MISLGKPSADTMRRFLATQIDTPLTYQAIGATNSSPPAGYDVDHTRVRLGEGEQIFGQAVNALRQWKQFQLGWVDAWPRDIPIEVGETIGVMGLAMGLWWRNACRIVYVVDVSGPIRRFGFAYGTLPGHVETGEERFLIEWNPQHDCVHYDILAFSKPYHWLTRIGYPLVRLKQKQFGRDSARAMLRAVHADEVNCWDNVEIYQNAGEYSPILSAS